MGVSGHLLLVWSAFALSGLAVVVAGTRLSRHSDRIADLTGLSGLWIGVVLMAASTSLPELLTDATAALIGAPDLAAGDLLGSNLANMLILGILDLLHRQKRIWQQATHEHALTAALAMALTALAGVFMLLEGSALHFLVGLDTALILLAYLLGMRVIYRQQDFKRRQREHERVVESDEARREPLRQAVLGFLRSALVILVAAPLLAWSASQIAELTALSTTFLGTTLVAFATSLPELVTSLAAIRLGAFDLAVGNLFGSNCFNMSALFFADLAYPGGPMLSAIDPRHALTAFWAVLMMCLGLMGIVYRAERRFLFLEPDSALLIGSYLVGLWILFL